MAVDCIADALGVRITKIKYKALCATANYRGQKLLLLKPETFMNASGLAVEAAAHFYKIPPERVLVLFDDISPTGCSPAFPRPSSRSWIARWAMRATPRSVSSPMDAKRRLHHSMASN